MAGWIEGAPLPLGIGSVPCCVCDMMAQNRLVCKGRLVD